MDRDSWPTRHGDAEKLLKAFTMTGWCCLEGLAIPERSLTRSLHRDCDGAVWKD